MLAVVSVKSPSGSGIEDSAEVRVGRSSRGHGTRSSLYNREGVSLWQAGARVSRSQCIFHLDNIASPLRHGPQQLRKTVLPGEIAKIAGNEEPYDHSPERLKDQWHAQKRLLWIENHKRLAGCTSGACCESPLLLHTDIFSNAYR